MTTTHNEYVYLSLMRKILSGGNVRGDRTGVGTKGLFGEQLKFNLSEGFPLLTTKKMFTKGIIHELIWFLSGDTHVKYLQDNDVKIWDAWSTEEECAKFNREEGDLGPIYGWQWRKFGAKFSSDPCGVDQIQKLVDGLKNNPNGRRHIVTGWNPKESDQVTLPPCHTMFQCYVEGENLSLHMYQRSADYFLGVPFNIASYALLTHMLAMVTDLKPSKLIISFGDVHIYSDHFEQCNIQLNREIYPGPKLVLTPRNNIEDFKFENFKFEGYKCHPAIKAPIAV